MSSHKVSIGFFARQWNRVKSVWARMKDFFCLPCGDESQTSHALAQQSHTMEIALNGSIARDDEKISTNHDLDSDNFRHFYNMDNARRGIALILNHEFFKFNFLPRRHGTDKDSKRLQAILMNLGFDVRVFDNLSTAGIFKELSNVAMKEDHSGSDCLIITVMTHGSRDSLFSFDGAYALRDMTKLFNNENCPSLKGKPRLFFIQACRGVLLDSGYNVPGQYSYKQLLIRTISSTSSVDAAPTETLSHSICFGSEEAEAEFLHNQPIYDDFLMIRSTMIDYASLRNKDKGSWFIQDLCGELEANGTTCDILNLMTRVNWAVSEREGCDYPSGPLYEKKVILCISTRLKKILQFNIKPQFKS